MAYTAIYYKNIRRHTGDTVRLTIYKNARVGETITAKEIGDFDDLNLEVQGGQSNLETPIVKTSLTFSMIDSSDKPDTDEVKYGSWEEFFTPSSTLYKVELMINGVIAWTGFVTPDSWQDDLVYRGRVSITARDNIGHMADFIVDRYDFDTDLISVRDLVQKGFDKANVVMDLNVPTFPDKLTAEGVSIYDWMLDIRAFIGKTWYEAIESLLDSLGLTLRWGARDNLVLTGIQNIPLVGYESAIAEVKEPVFISRSGHREVVPAYRQVTDRITYDTPEDETDTFDVDNINSGEIGDDWQPAIYSLSDNTISLAGGSVSASVKAFTGDSFGDYGEKSKYLLLRMMKDSVNFGICRSVKISPMTTVGITFKLAHTYSYRSVAFEGSGNKLTAGDVRIFAEWNGNDGVSKYYDGQNNVWSDTTAPLLQSKFAEDAASHEVSVNISCPETSGKLLIYIFGITEESNSDTPYRYARFGDFCVSINADSFPRGQKTSVTYNTSQNCVLERHSEFGVIPAFVGYYGSIINGIYRAADNKTFPAIGPVQNSGSGQELPLSVWVAMQHIAMHANPNNILTGILRDSEGRIPGFNQIWQKYGRSFVLHSGTLNLIDGFVHNAVLIEFGSFEDLWAGIEVDYKHNESAGGFARPNVNGGSQSSSSSSSGGESSYVLPIATQTKLGGIMLGPNTTDDELLPLRANIRGGAYTRLYKANVVAALGYTPAKEGSYLTEVPIANASTVGGFKTGFNDTQMSKAVKVDSYGRAYVDIPESSGGGSTGGTDHYIGTTKTQSAPGTQDVTGVGNLEANSVTIADFLKIGNAKLYVVDNKLYLEAEDGTKMSFAATGDIAAMDQGI